MKPLLAVAAALHFSFVSVAYGLGNLPHGNVAKSISSEEKAFGREGDPQRATRTINIEVRDAAHFSPAELNIKADETVRFEVRNSGKTMHEMVLGRIEDLKQVELQRKLPGVPDDEPYATRWRQVRAIAWSGNSPGQVSSITPVWHPATSKPVGSEKL